MYVEIEGTYPPLPVGSHPYLPIQLTFQKKVSKVDMHRLGSVKPFMLYLGQP